MKNLLEQRVIERSSCSLHALENGVDVSHIEWRRIGCVNSHQCQHDVGIKVTLFDFEGNSSDIRNIGVHLCNSWIGWGIQNRYLLHVMTGEFWTRNSEKGSLADSETLTGAAELSVIAVQ